MSCAVQQRHSHDQDQRLGRSPASPSPRESEGRPKELRSRIEKVPTFAGMTLPAIDISWAIDKYLHIKSANSTG